MASQLDHSGLLREASSQITVSQWDGTDTTTAPAIFASLGITVTAGLPLMLIQVHDRQGLPKPGAIVYITYARDAAAIGSELPSAAGTTQGYVTNYGTVYSTQVSTFFGGIMAAAPSQADGNLTAAERITHVVTANERGMVAMKFGGITGLKTVHFLISSGGADIDVTSIVTFTS